MNQRQRNKKRKAAATAIIPKPSLQEAFDVVAEHTAGENCLFIDIDWDTEPRGQCFRLYSTSHKYAVSKPVRGV